MKKRMLLFFLVCTVLLSAIPVHAAGARFSVSVEADRKNVKPGETVYFTVVAEGEDVVALQFNLDIPSGMKYVPGSAATPEGLKDKLGVPAADWTEISMIFTYYNDVGIKLPKGTVLLTFACTAETVGNHQVGLIEVLPFNSEFEEFTPSVQSAAVTVSKAEEQGGDQPTTSQPTEEPTTEPTKEPTTEPTEEPTTQPSEDASGTQPTDPTETTTVTTPEETQPTEPGVEIGIDTVPTEDTEQNTATQATGDDATVETTPSENTSDQEAEKKDDVQPDEDEQGSGLLVLWIVLGAAAVAAGAVILVLWLKKKMTA